MYKMTPKNQDAFDNFYLPFGGKLNPKNRWVILADQIPWQLVEKLYAQNFNGDSGNVAKDARLAYGALIIKEMIKTTDRGVVEHIRENPYLQFFLGCPNFTDDELFHNSSMTHFRKRFRQEDLAAINDETVRRAQQKSAAEKDNDKQRDDRDNDNMRKNSTDGENKTKTENSGELIVDATCAPADITYPTDLKLLNTAREKTEAMIDKMFAPLSGLEKKPRTYRQKAKKQYLAVAKKRKPGGKKIRQALHQQLNHLERNLKTIFTLENKGLDVMLSRVQISELFTIRKLGEQQRQMYDQKTHRVDNRIVSISQPHIRPIVRGKAAAPVEFGAKISLSVAGGFTFLDRLSFDAYNEAGDLPGQIETYHKRNGFYPAKVLADQIYLTKKNRLYCIERGIVLAGLAKRTRAEKVLADGLADASLSGRVAVEGKIGQAKRRFSLSRVMAKLKSTAVAMISISIAALNLQKILAGIFCREIFSRYLGVFLSGYRFLKNVLFMGSKFIGIFFKHRRFSHLTLATKL